MSTNQDTPHNKNTLLFKLEQDIATLLVDKLEHFDLTFERASQIAKFVLAHLPENITDQQVLELLPSLDDEFFELAVVVNKRLHEYEEQYKEDIVKQTQDLIKHKHFEEASKLTSNYFARKIQA